MSVADAITLMVQFGSFVVSLCRNPGPETQGTAP
ncbi:putative holin-like toxin [Alicyclobacillus sendaiensis]|nr:putative holin-like toxin [Alicyclobacillus sendaiensis]